MNANTGATTEMNTVSAGSGSRIRPYSTGEKIREGTHKKVTGYAMKSRIDIQRAVVQTTQSDKPGCACISVDMQNYDRSVCNDFFFEQEKYGMPKVIAVRKRHVCPSFPQAWATDTDISTCTQIFKMSTHLSGILICSAQYMGSTSSTMAGTSVFSSSTSHFHKFRAVGPFCFDQSGQTVDFFMV
jgi:hypothetical protein